MKSSIRSAATILAVVLLTLAGPAGAVIFVPDAQSIISSASIDGTAATGSYTNPTSTSFTVTANNADYWYTGGREAEFVYKAVTGDFTLVAQANWSPVPNVYNPEGGLLFANSTTSAAKSGSYLLWGAQLASSPTADILGTFVGGTGTNDYYVNGGPAVGSFNPNSGTPIWLKLTRVGDVFHYSNSIDSTNGVDGTWIDSSNTGTTQSTYAAIGSTVYVGFAVADSNSNTGSATMNFANVDFVPEPATMALLAMGGVGLLLKRRRSK